MTVPQISELRALTRKARAGMAKRRAKKRVYKKTSKKTKRGMSKKETRIMYFRSQPFAPVLYTKFKFSQTKFLNSVAGIPATLEYRHNSPYDPDKTGVGNACAWYSTLLASDGPYSHYRVISSKIKVMFASNSTAGNIGQVYCWVGWRREDVPTVDNYTDARLSPHYQARMCNTLYNKPVYMTLAKSTANIFGIKDIEDVSGTSATYNQIPTLKSIWDIGIQALDQVSQATGHVTVDIEYYVELYSDHVEATDD